MSWNDCALPGSTLTGEATAYGLVEICGPPGRQNVSQSYRLNLVANRKISVNTRQCKDREVNINSEFKSTPMGQDFHLQASWPEPFTSDVMEPKSDVVYTSFIRRATISVCKS